MDKVLVYLVIANACLSAAALALHKLVEVFPGLQAADSIVGKIVAAAQKIVDFLSANVSHPTAVPAAASVAPALSAPKA